MKQPMVEGVNIPQDVPVHAQDLLKDLPPLHTDDTLPGSKSKESVNTIRHSKDITAREGDESTPWNSMLQGPPQKPHTAEDWVQV